MPPKGKSKALAEKHSYLGRFTENAKSLEEMRLKISNQEKTLFQCIICYEHRPNRFSCCYVCGRHFGCYTCIVRLGRCAHYVGTKTNVGNAIHEWPGVLFLYQ